VKGGTLFSGIGAPECAMPRVDWRWCAETDQFASAVMAARHPEIPNLGDVNEIAADAVEPVDLIVFGSPCQSFSVAGKRLGPDDPRGNMALVGLRVVGRIRPRWVVWENVPGVLSSDGGRDFGAFLGLLGELGYGFAYRVLDAQHFGVPQRRRRVFVVGYLGDWRPAAAVLFEPESLRGDSAPRREAGQGVARPIASCAPGGSGYRFDADTADNLIARCVATGTNGQRYDYETETMVLAHSLRADGFDASKDVTGRGTPLTLAIRGRGDSHDLEWRDDGVANAVLTPNGGRGGIGVGAIAAYGIRRDAGRDGVAKTPSDDGYGRVSLRDPGFNVYEETAPTLDSAPHAVAFHENQRAETTLSDTAGALKVGGGKPGQGYPAVFESRFARNGRGAPDEIVPPLKAQSGQSGKGDAAPLLQSAMSVRRLTPRECERLQGLPDDYTLIPYRGKPAADGPRYRAIGNSMAVPVIGWIGERIAAVDEITAFREAAE